MSHILVTGATGFIASHLLPILHQRNHAITAAIRGNFEQKITFPLKIVKITDIDGLTDWGEALQNIDIVIHLAARAHILQETIPNAEKEFLRVNTQGTANLAKQAIKAGVKQFIFISSIGAMATLCEEKLQETDSTCKPDTPYGHSKLQAEQALREIASQSEMSWTILRPTLVYGPGNPGNMERLVKLVKLGLPLPFGSINNRRSFLYVGNLVDAIACTINNPYAFNQIFLVSDGEDLSTPELIKRLSQKIDKPCQLLPVPLILLRGLGYIGEKLQSFTVKPLAFNQTTIDRLLGSLYVDSSHIQNTLNWYPPFSVDEGLSQTIKL